MKFSLTLVVSALSIMALVVGQTTTRAYVIPPTGSEPERPLVKRSLCNTFGGCGAKRSMHLSVYNGRQYETPDGYIAEGASNEPWSVDRGGESDSERIKEILTDLIDYLKTSEKFRQGKYTVLVPVPKPNSSAKGTGKLRLSAMDIQEIGPSSLPINYITNNNNIKDDTE